MPFNNLKEKRSFGAEGVLIFQGKEEISKTRFLRHWYLNRCGSKVWASPCPPGTKTLIDILSARITEVGENDRTFKENRSVVSH